MAIHTSTVQLPIDTYDRINRLLTIESLEEMTDAELLSSGAQDHYTEGIFTAQFDDGSSLNFDLCSGTSNYFDDVVWSSADGKTDVILDCDYELSDIEAEINGELYFVCLDLTD